MKSYYRNYKDGKTPYLPLNRDTNRSLQRTFYTRDECPINDHCYAIETYTHTNSAISEVQECLDGRVPRRQKMYMRKRRADGTYYNQYIGMY